MYIRAEEKAGTVDAAKGGGGILNSFRDEPSILGPRSFSPQLHIQDRSPFLIVSISNHTGKVIDSWRVSEPIPNEVLYRLKK